MVVGLRAIKWESDRTHAGACRLTAAHEPKECHNSAAEGVEWWSEHQGWGS
jgi:hypothetical protein